MIYELPRGRTRERGFPHNTGLTVTHSSLTFSPLRQPTRGEAVSDELPKLFSDEEFNEQRLVRERLELADRRIEERRARSVQAPEHTDGLPQSTIEQKYPHVAKKLTSLWRSEACTVYLSALTVADRPDRQGFPLEVMEDLMMLYEINDMLSRKPGLEQAAAAPSAWGEAARREHD